MTAGRVDSRRGRRAVARRGLVLPLQESWLTGCRMLSLPNADHCHPLLDAGDSFWRIFGLLKATFESEGLKYIEITLLFWLSSAMGNDLSCSQGVRFLQ